jgi:hypothetical protein
VPGHRTQELEQLSPSHHLDPMCLEEVMLNSNTLHCHNLIIPSYSGFSHLPASASPQSYHCITVTVTNVTCYKKGNYTSFNAHFSWLSAYAGLVISSSFILDNFMDIATLNNTAYII